MTRARRAAWAAAFAIATVAAFPHPVGDRVVDLGLVAGWLAPALLLRALAGQGPRAAARTAFFAAWPAFAALHHWIYVATVDYGHAPPPIGVAATFGIALYPAPFFAVFGAAWGFLARTRLASPFAAAALWVALEHGRAFVATGMPWGLIGYSQHANPALMAAAPIGGIWALSFAVALGGAAIALWRTTPRASRAALAVVAALLAAGALDAARERETPTDTVRVAVVQGNVDQDVKWSRAFAERTLSDYETLTRRAAAQGAELVVWPETAVPGSPDWDPAIASRLAELAIETRTALVVGAVGMERLATGGARFYDSAFVYAADGTTVDRYDKTHLVPFGEYVPFRDWLGRWVTAIARGAATTDVSQGRAVRSLAIPLAAGGSLTAGVPICYELLFPDGVRRFVDGAGARSARREDDAGPEPGRTGAELLLAITNDAWYGRTGAPYQFLVMTALRSAENRVWTARAANTGVSALIDHRGRVRMQTELFEQTLLVGDVPRRPTPLGGSFYARHGDWLPAACWIALAACAVAGVRRRGATS